MIKRFLTRQFDPAPFLARIQSGKLTIYFKPGETVFKPGSASDTVFYLQAGIAKETVASPQGRSAVVRMLEPGSFFGTSALDGGKHPSTVTTITKCTVIGIEKAAMFAALREPAFSELFTAYLLHYIGRVENDKVDLLFNSVQTRLAKKLLVLAHVTEGETRLIGAEINQETLAEMVGTTRPRVNFFLNRFRKLGLITYERDGITVHQTMLKAVLEDDPILSQED